MRIIQRPKVCRGRHRLAAAAAAAVAAPLQQPSAVDQHHPSSSAGEQLQPPSAVDQQQPPSAVDQQPPSAVDQHRRHSSPGDQQQQPSAATEQQPSSTSQTPQPSSAAKQQEPPSTARAPQLPSAAKQQQPPSTGKQPQPLSEQHQPLSAGEQQSPSAAEQHQSPSAAESSQPQPPSPGDSHQQPCAAAKHQPLSAANQCQPPSAGEQQQQGVLESINNLRAFNQALTLFLSRFDALTDHLNHISTSIAAAAAARDPNEEVTTVVAVPLSELDTSCRRWKSLQEYVTTHLSDVDRLRAQVPAALQRAPDTARVVLNVIYHGGRYYLNPPWAYEGANNPKVTERRVCILILEFYLSGCFPTGGELICGKINSITVRIALQWRKRLIGEGGIASAGAVDALGLLLFLGSFGVPEEFSLEDLYELLHLSKSEKEVHVIRRSPFLLEKMPGVINYMTSKDMHTEAVDFVFLFGLEEKFDPLSMLSCLLHKAKQASEEEVRDEQLPLISVKESNEKYLTVLESVAKCRKVHKLDTSESDFNIEQRIVMLQTESVEIVQKLKDRSMKRNAEEAGPLDTRETQPKCSRPSALTPENVKIVSELDTSCRRWKALRRYVTTHLSDVDRLRDEVPAALQRAPDPAQVVLNVIHSGRYYLDPPRSYEGANNPKVTKRRVCILILEFYLSGCFPTRHDLIRRKIDSKAVRVAFEWRKRLISEGGIASAGAVDSLGLLLFLGSFGVPEEFSSEDLYELLHLSKSEKEAHVLRKSPFLLEKMHGVINDMVSKDMHVEAVDIVFLFGLEAKFDPLSMLSCLLHKAKQVSDEEMRDEQLPLISVKESNEKYLTVLESVARCLEVYKLDSSGFDFNIEQMIMTLRTKNAEIVRKLKDRNIKRKNAEIVQKLKDRIIKRDAEEAGPLYAPETLPKRPRPSATELTREIPGI